MSASSVHLIVFSKDRPLQLHGMLTSVFRHWRGDFAVDVLVYEDNDTPAVTLDAYEAIRREFASNPCALTYESDFAEEVGIFLEDETPYVCFGCDDVVYTLPVDVAEVAAAFDAEPGLLGYSLRLGGHIKADMFGRDMRMPDRLDLGDDRFLWDAANSQGDWGYPWEVLGTVYRTEFVRRMVGLLANSGQANNPSHLEHYGAQRWREAAGRSLMACSWSTRLVVPTVNLVQQEFGNGIVGPPGLDTAFLLDCWNRGLRLDVERYRGMAPPSWRIGDFFLKRAG